MVDKVIVVGSGGREHALGEKLMQDGVEVIFAPGNGGTKRNADVGLIDFKGLVELAKKENAFTVVGPDSPLNSGIVDYFQKY